MGVLLVIETFNNAISRTSTADLPNIATYFDHAKHLTCKRLKHATDMSTLCRNRAVRSRRGLYDTVKEGKRIEFNLIICNPRVLRG